MLLTTSEMSLDLQQNEIVFYVDLPQGDPTSVIEELKALGYSPEPKHYTWYRDGDSHQPVHETCALLHRSINPDAEALLSLLQVQWDKLYERFGGSVALVMGTDD